jgi:phage-related protein
MYNPPMKAIIFVGRSLDEIKAFPMVVMREAGFQLHKIQQGYPASNWKPLKSVGSGVREIRILENGGAYRVIYVAKFDEAIYVLHAFQKKTQKTRKLDLEIAKRSYKAVIEGRKNE